MSERFSLVSGVLGSILVFSGCTKEECESLIPEQVADRIAREFSCDATETLGIAALSNAFYLLCVQDLKNDAGYQLHCGQHGYFSDNDLRSLCERGRKMFLQRCHESNKADVSQPLENGRQSFATQQSLD